MRRASWCCRQAHALRAHAIHAHTPTPALGHASRPSLPYRLVVQLTLARLLADGMTKSLTIDPATSHRPCRRLGRGCNTPTHTSPRTPQPLQPRRKDAVRHASHVASAEALADRTLTVAYLQRQASGRPREMTPSEPCPPCSHAKNTSISPSRGC